MHPLLYRLAADVTVVIHAVYVLFVLLGQLLILCGALRNWGWVRNPWFRWVHLTAIAIVVGEAWCGVTCPLTTWEHSLRKHAGQSTYQGDFIANFVHQSLFFDLPGWVFTLGYSLFGLIVVGSLLAAPPHSFRRQQAQSCRAPEPTVS